MINPSNQEKYLLVAGGVDESNVPMDSVELLKIGSNSWQTGRIIIRARLRKVVIEGMACQLPSR